MTRPIVRGPTSYARYTEIPGTVVLNGGSSPVVFSGEVESATRLDSGSGFFTRIKLREAFDFTSDKTVIRVSVQVPGLEDVRVTHARFSTPSVADVRREFDVVIRDAAGVMVTTADLVIHFEVAGES